MLTHRLALAEALKGLLMVTWDSWRAAILARPPQSCKTLTAIAASPCACQGCDVDNCCATFQRGRRLSCLPHRICGRRYYSTHLQTRKEVEHG